MAYFSFTQKILSGIPIPVFNQGKMRRDFTYIDDITEAVVRVIDRPATANPGWSGDEPDPATSYAPWRIYNVGNNQQVELLQFIQMLEDCLGEKAKMELLPMQPGDVTATMANISALDAAVGFAPSTPIEAGLAQFVEWCRVYYDV